MRIQQFNGDISDWDVSNVQNMARMFQDSRFNGDLSNWDVSNVEDMGEMFRKSQFNAIFQAGMSAMCKTCAGCLWILDLTATFLAGMSAM